MLYVATVHYRSPDWIEIQARHLREHISVPFQTWTSLEGIDPAYAVHFDRVLEQRGSHAGKLNHMAREISHVAAEDDLIMFLDGDAFPIADPPHCRTPPVNFPGRVCACLQEPCVFTAGSGP